MPMPAEQRACPLCSVSASMQPSDFGDRRLYRCENCKEFVIAALAEKMLAKLPARLARYAALARKGSDDSMLVIYRAHLEPGEAPQLQASILSRREALTIDFSKLNED